MIRDVKAWEAWERAQVASTPNDFHANLRWAGEALAFARKIGVFPPADPLEGIEHKIRLARLINCSKNSFAEPPKREEP